MTRRLREPIFGAQWPDCACQQQRPADEPTRVDDINDRAWSFWTNEEQLALAAWIDSIGGEAINTWRVEHFPGYVEVHEYIRDGGVLHVCPLWDGGDVNDHARFRVRRLEPTTPAPPVGRALSTVLARHNLIALP
jgi:hypothetical protein